MAPPIWRRTPPRGFRPQEIPGTLELKMVGPNAYKSTANEAALPNLAASQCEADIGL